MGRAPRGGRVPLRHLLQVHLLLHPLLHLLLNLFLGYMLLGYLRLLCWQLLLLLLLWRLGRPGAVPR